MLQRINHFQILTPTTISSLATAKDQKRLRKSNQRAIKKATLVDIVAGMVEGKK